MILKLQLSFRLFLLITAVFFGCVCISAQTMSFEPKSKICTELPNFKNPSAADFQKAEDALAEDGSSLVLTLPSAENERRLRIKIPDQINDEPVLMKDDASAVKEEKPEKFHWKPALIQSGIFLGIQHGYRMTQVKTRRELGGAFFRDWGNSVKGLRGWKDSDSIFINYVAHPLQGGLTGRIFVNNSDRAKKQEFGKSKQYWMSRFKAMGWSAVWSVQFELGPISEASLGNVGIREKRGHSTMAFVDLVVTPTIGTGVLIGEDAIDKYILKNWIEKNARRTTVKIRILRSILTPTRSVSNLLRGKVTWKRDDRLLE